MEVEVSMKIKIYGTDDDDGFNLGIEKIIRFYEPKAVIVISCGRNFYHFQEIYYLVHDNVFVFKRSGFLNSRCLLRTFGIADCQDGTTAAEAAFSAGAARVIFCYRTTKYVQYWQQERRKGIQLYLQMHKDGPAFLDDFHFSGDIPSELLKPDTALIAHNDELAAQIIDAAKSAGYQAGKDYKIIGFGDDTRFRDYDLTTMCTSTSTKPCAMRPLRSAMYCCSTSRQELSTPCASAWADSPKR